MEQSTTSSVLFQGSGRGSVGDRRTVHQLERSGSVRISSDISDPSGPFEDVGGSVYDSHDRPILAETAVVSTAASVTGGRASVVTGRSGSTANAPLQSEIPRHQGSAFDCVAAIQRRYRKAGLSGRAASFVAHGRRGATLKIYASRLRPYFKWCRDRDIAANHASVAQVSDFLCTIFDKGLQVTTIRGYLSAILIIHEGTPGGGSLRDDNTLKLLLEGMHNSAPPKRRIWPSWDLDQVLGALNQLPFEPILSATIRDVAIKTAFLIALASGRRCSEIHALAISDHIIFSRRGVTLHFRPSFLAKNERSNFSAAPVFLPKLDSSSSNQRFSCPVRALKWYLNKTQSIRGQINHLFITSAKPYRPAARTTISGWIVDAIVRSKAVQGQGRPNAHSVRAMASTTAFHKGISIPEIVNTVSWKSDHIFITTYLKDKPPQSSSARFASAVLTSSSL